MLKLELADGRQVEGAPLDIVEQMQLEDFNGDDLSAKEFINKKADTFGFSLDASAMTVEDAATVFVRALVAAGHAQPLQ